MSFNYLLESDMYSRPFELSRVQSARDIGGVADSFLGGIQSGQKIVANDIQIGVQQMKAQEAQMRLAAMDQEIMVGMNKEAYLSARANRKLLEARTQGELKRLNQDTVGLQDRSQMQKLIASMGEKRIPVPGGDGRAYVPGYKDGKFVLLPETDKQWGAYKNKNKRSEWYRELEILKKGRPSAMERNPNSASEKRIIELQGLISGKPQGPVGQGQGQGFGGTETQQKEPWTPTEELSKKAEPGMKAAFQDQKVRKTFDPYVQEFGPDAVEDAILEMLNQVEVESERRKESGGRGVNYLGYYGSTAFKRAARFAREFPDIFRGVVQRAAQNQPQDGLGR